MSGEGVQTGEFGRDRPQSRCGIAIDGVCIHSPYARLGQADFGGQSDIHVFEIDTTQAVEGDRRRSPDCRGGALLCRLETLVDGASVIYPAGRDHLLSGQVTLKGCHDAARMHGEGADAVVAAECVEVHREEAVGSLGLPVRDPFVVVGVAREVQVVEPNAALSRPRIPGQNSRR